MRTLRITAVMATVMALGMVGLLQVAGADSPHQYLVVCHRTHSATNPFVVIVTAWESGNVAHKEGGPDSPQPPGHEGDIVFGPMSHSDAKALAAEGLSICVEEEAPPPAPPAPKQPGAPPVTG